MIELMADKMARGIKKERLNILQRLLCLNTRSPF